MLSALQGRRYLTFEATLHYGEIETRGNCRWYSKYSSIELYPFIVLFQEEAGVAEGVVEVLDVEEEEEVVVASVEEVEEEEEEEVSEGAPEEVAEDLEVFILKLFIYTL